MFICTNCNSIDKFELMFNPNYQGSKAFDINIDENQLSITVDGYTFSPDIRFMQNHAVCKYCGEINIWDYKT